MLQYCDVDRPNRVVKLPTKMFSVDGAIFAVINISSAHFWHLAVDKNLASRVRIVLKSGSINRKVPERRINNGTKRVERCALARTVDHTVFYMHYLPTARPCSTPSSTPHGEDDAGKTSFPTLLLHELMNIEEDAPANLFPFRDLPRGRPLQKRNAPCDPIIAERRQIQ
ncbi:hypothetical protein TcasGA2_TC001304 [Tribolium castaneum]|uniref:Uncharacterized protein n=1 Tax=Tribolium castaneum TaxID=7070 RepID=D6WBT6_TRICA|nr:hypothetical protein TcasGA2_TC001304 [Tribolium castaneum]